MSTLEDLLREYKTLGIGEQLDYGKLTLYSIVTHSTAIEGSTITEIENRRLFEEGIRPNKPVAEQWMNLDLKAAYDEAFRIADARSPVTVDCMDASHPRHRRYAHRRRALWQHQAHYVL